MKRKVKFLKDHVNSIKKGDIGEFNDARADYLVREGIAEYVEDSKKNFKQAVKNEPCKTC